MIKEIKHNFMNYMRKNWKENIFYNFLIKMNMYLFHYNLREHKRSFGEKNRSVIFFLIRPRGMEEGLLSMYNGMVEECYYAIQKGYIPIVDLEHYNTQYSMFEKINGTNNAWEHYFIQPCHYTLEEVYQSKNVILSGWNVKRNKEHNESLIKNSYNVEELKKLNKFIKQYCDIQPYIKEIVEEKFIDLLSSFNTLGVFLRGTDYVAFQPKGHPIQPNIETVLSKTKEFVEKYKINRIFLATEDYKIYKQFSNEFGKILISSDENYVKDYDGTDYIYKYIKADSNYDKGLSYLIKMLLLAKCNYLVTSLASGSTFAFIMNESKYKDYFIFDLGLY